jgi:lipopolysaccharide transport system permease protein
VKPQAGALAALLAKCVKINRSFGMGSGAAVAFERSWSPAHGGSRWRGDYLFLIQNLIAKDLKVRYRNMSLGVLWSLLNPLVMMTVLWFIFTKIIPNNVPHFAVFVLCGLVPYNMFTISWLSGTTSLIENAGLIKRVAVPREIIPIAAVLANCTQMAAQVLLLLLFVILSGVGVNRYWFWLLLIWPLEVVFVVGLSLVSSAWNVYVRDTRYVVESVNVVLFWLVPIFYPFSKIPEAYRDLYQFNPVAALVMACHNILIEGVAPPGTLLVKFTAVSLAAFVAGLYLFRQMRRKFYNYL